MSGALFRIELDFKEITVWLNDKPRPRKIKSSELQSVHTMPDGSTKIAVEFHKDIIVPTSASEWPKVVDALNALIDEQLAAKQRDREAGTIARRKSRGSSEPGGSGRTPHGWRG